MPYQRLAKATLAQCRAIERRLEDLNPMSPEADELKLQSYGLRDDYQYLIAQAVAYHGPEPETTPFSFEPIGGQCVGAVR